jgi:pimeloyl-ACP methyl ester carboxylesterase
MLGLSRARLFLFLLAGLAGGLLAGTGSTRAADDKTEKKGDVEFKRVQLPTCDGMELDGTFYPGASGKRDACVLLLHNFTAKKGGGSHQDSWDMLAAMLQKEGYSVLSFDFRGFGGSKSVSDKFWSHPHNRGLLRGPAASGRKLPVAIDEKDFPANYYSFLVNDIAAARAFLDRRNDAGEVNTSNLVVIGAGEGATLGALWMAAECRRYKAPAMIGLGPPKLANDSEGKDIAAALWLSISPSLAGVKMAGLRAALTETARDNKIPTVFIYGKNDEAAGNTASTYYKVINTLPNGKSAELKDTTGTKGIERTALSGSKLLQDRDRLGTAAFILNHLNKVMDARGSRESKKRELDRFAYYWVLPGRRQPILAKMAGEDYLHPIPTFVSKVAGP